MNWLFVLVGVAVGWLIEWLLDVFFWRRRTRVLRRANTDLEIELAQGREERQVLQRLVDQHEESQGELASCRAELSARQDELREQQQELAKLTVAIDDLRAQLTAREQQIADCLADLSSCQDSVSAKETELNLSAEQLARVTEAMDGLRAQLVEREQQVADCQADLEFKTNELAALAQELAAARTKLEISGSSAQPRVQASPVEPEQLHKIEGIGPKIERILHEQGILTYQQLAAASPTRLEQILAEAGPHFKLADPSTWPMQAELVAKGDWEALKRLQDRLSGGRDTDGPELTQ